MISAAVVDFGSTNSGCCILRDKDQNGNLAFSNPFFLQNTGSYAKDNTWMFIDRDLLDQISRDYDSLTDDDFRICSRILPDTQNPNIFWGRDVIKRYASQITEQGMVGFQKFKMMFYHGQQNYAALNYPINLIIKTFLRILKIEVLVSESRVHGRKIGVDEIQWGLTIPSIWTDDNKRVMVRLAQDVFTPVTRILSEPEGPLVYSLFMSSTQGRVDFRDGRTSFVVDLGGGTSDICLMKEMKQEDGSFKMVMVANSDGQAAGGNDIDHDFYVYMLRNLSAGKTSDTGVAYDTLNDDQIYDQLWRNFRSNLAAYIDMEDNWFSLKNQPNHAANKTVAFTFNTGYKNWLKEHGHTALSNQVREYLCDGCEYSSDEFIARVFRPTIDRICEKVVQLAKNAKNLSHVDRVVFGGGLSCNHLVAGLVKDTLRNALNDSNIEIGDMGPLMAGGSIAAGAGYVLLNRDFIQRIATKNYYYDMVSDIISLHDVYQQRGVNISWGELSNVAGRLILNPIFLKGDIIRETYINDNLCASEDQTTVNVAFYSTTDKLAFAPDVNNNDLKLIGELNTLCHEKDEFRLEVDFNEASISNAPMYRLIRKDSGELLGEGYFQEVNNQ